MTFGALLSGAAYSLEVESTSGVWTRLVVGSRAVRVDPVTYQFFIFIFIFIFLGEGGLTCGCCDSESEW